MKKIILLSASAFLLIACSEEAQNETESVASVSSSEVVSIESVESVIPEQTEAFSDNKLVTDDFTVEITDVRVIAPGEEGNDYGDEPVIAFWYDTTVNEGVTDEINPTSAWIMNFTAIQDNDPNAINTLGVSSLPDSNHRDSQMQTIKPGGTVSSSVAYTLTDSETPVELVAEDIMGDEYGSQMFEIK